jgi:hypothetical protein
MLFTHSLRLLSTLTYLSSLHYFLTCLSAHCLASHALNTYSPTAVHAHILVQPPLFCLDSLSLSGFYCSLYRVSCRCPPSHTCPASTIWSRFSARCVASHARYTYSRAAFHAQILVQPPLITSFSACCLASPAAVHFYILVQPALFGLDSLLAMQLLVLITHTLWPLSTLTYLSSLHYLLSSFSACCPASPARCTDSPAAVHPHILVQLPLFGLDSLLAVWLLLLVVQTLLPCQPSHTCPASTIS